MLLYNYIRYCWLSLVFYSSYFKLCYNFNIQVAPVIYMIFSLYYYFNSSLLPSVFQFLILLLSTIKCGIHPGIQYSYKQHHFSHPFILWMLKEFLCRINEFNISQNITLTVWMNTENSITTFCSLVSCTPSTGYSLKNKQINPHSVLSTCRATFQPSYKGLSSKKAPSLGQFQDGWWYIIIPYSFLPVTPTIILAFFRDVVFECCFLPALGCWLLGS